MAGTVRAGRCPIPPARGVVPSPGHSSRAGRRPDCRSCPGGAQLPGDVTQIQTAQR